MGSSYLYGTDQMCFTKQVFIILFTDFSYGHNKVLKQTHLFSVDNVQFDFTHVKTLQYWWNLSGFYKKKDHSFTVYLPKVRRRK